MLMFAQEAVKAAPNDWAAAAVAIAGFVLLGFFFWLLCRNS